ncbi:MAG: flagellar basal body-associated FliL family protein [Nitrospirota bacterium]
MVRQAHHDNVILSLSKDVEGYAAFVNHHALLKGYINTAAGGSYMADEELEKESQESSEPQKETTRKGKKKLIIIIAGAMLISLVSGYFAYTMVIGKKLKSGETVHEKEKESAKTELFALDPFVMNLADHGRFLKVSIQLEISDKSYHQIVADKIPNLRDAIIILVSSKTFESISSPEGKFQLKDELLLRANQTIGKDVFKNLYFTEFVMQ